MYQTRLALFLALFLSAGCAASTNYKPSAPTPRPGRWYVLHYSVDPGEPAQGGVDPMREKIGQMLFDAFPAGVRRHKWKTRPLDPARREHFLFVVELFVQDYKAGSALVSNVAGAIRVVTADPISGLVRSATKDHLNVLYRVSSPLNGFVFERLVGYRTNDGWGELIEKEANLIAKELTKDVWTEINMPRACGLCSAKPIVGSCVNCRSRFCEPHLAQSPTNCASCGGAGTVRVP